MHSRFDKFKGGINHESPKRSAVKCSNEHGAEGHAKTFPRTVSHLQGLQGHRGLKTRGCSARSVNCRFLVSAHSGRMVISA